MKFTTLVFAALGASLALNAAEPTLGFALKLRANLGWKAEDEVRTGLAVGFATSYPMLGGRIEGEFGYTYYGGQQFRAAIPSNTIGANASNSVLSQKNELNGLHLRASYCREITPDWYWRAGLAFTNFKSTQESIADFNTGTPATQQGGWAANVEKSALSVSPFVGVEYRPTPNGAFEFNLVALSYKQAMLDPVFKPTAASGSQVTPSLGSKTVNTLKYEIGYAFRF